MYGETYLWVFECELEWCSCTKDIPFYDNIGQANNVLLIILISREYQLAVLITLGTVRHSCPIIFPFWVDGAGRVPSQSIS